MSRELFDAVWRNSPARGTDLLVLVALADGTIEANGPWCEMSVRHLAKRCRTSVRSVQLSIRRQMQAGALMVSGIGGRHGWNRFQIVPPDIDQRPGPLPLTEAQRGARLLGSAASAQRVAPPMQAVAPPVFDSAQSVAPGGRKALHRGDATACTTDAHPVAQPGAKPCTQDSEYPVSSPSTDDGDGGESPPLGQQQKAPPRPPRGGKGTQATAKPSLRAMVAALETSPKSAQAKTSASVRPLPYHRHNGD